MPNGNLEKTARPEKKRGKPGAEEVDLPGNWPTGTKKKKKGDATIPRAWRIAQAKKGRGGGFSAPPCAEEADEEKGSGFQGGPFFQTFWGEAVLLTPKKKRIRFFGDQGRSRGMAGRGEKKNR